MKVFYPRHSREELIELISRRLPELAGVLPLKRVVLFGSWAKGRATAFSDVDLLVIYADPRRPDAFEIVHEVIDLRGLEPHVYSETEAKQVEHTLQRMAKNGVILLDDRERK